MDGLKKAVSSTVLACGDDVRPMCYHNGKRL